MVKAVVQHLFHMKKTKYGSYFLHIHLKPQLIELVNAPKLYPLFTSHIVIYSTIIFDLTSSKLYKELVYKHNL